MSEQPSSDLQSLIQVRREKLARLRELGVDPFGTAYSTTTTPAQLKADFKEDQQVKVAGRIVALRNMGKSQFFQIGDVEGRIQGFLHREEISADLWPVWKCLERGDWVGIEGTTFLTKTGEPTIKVSNFQVMAKSLRPLPDKFHGLTNREACYRNRHLDLIANEESGARFVLRSKILSSIRRFFEDLDYLEVETPMLQDQAGGAAARPFATHHNALGIPLTLRIAPELFLKRLLVGGFTRIFELNRNFRNEGISRRHNPEFTMLEAYQVGADFEIMAELVEELVCSLAQTYCGGLEVPQYDENGELSHTVNLARPWKRAEYKDLVCEVAGKDWFEISAAERRTRAEQELKIQIGSELEDYEVTQQVFEKLVEEKAIDPLFVTRVSSELIPLAKTTPADPSTIEVYELVVNGMELSPGYSELNDPDLQRERFAAQSGGEEQVADAQFIEALESGMPAAGGIGIGIDRLIMLLTGASSIRDVVLFPQLKPSPSESQESQ